MCPGCQFPVEWQGVWFQQGVRPYMTIDEDDVSSKGVCHKIEGSQVIVVKQTSQHPCYSCLVIHSTHRNLIHYKESKNHPRRQFKNHSTLVFQPYHVRPILQTVLRSCAGRYLEMLHCLLSSGLTTGLSDVQLVVQDISPTTLDEVSVTTHSPPWRVVL